MESVRIKPVETDSEMGLFIEFPHRLYRDCEQYVPDLDSEIRNTFDPEKNAGMKFSEIQPFLAYRGDEVVGRIVGIVNRRANETWKEDVVRFGMIEFVDDLEVSKALIGAVEEWGAKQGMKKIQGPLGVTDFDKEGMLVEDFDRMATIVEIYNYPYYPVHMEKLGFGKEVDWLQIKVAVPAEVPKRYARTAKMSKEMFNLRVIKVNRKEAMGEWGMKLMNLMNEAYAELFGFSQMEQEQKQKFLAQYVPLLDLDMVPFVVNEKNELVAAAVTLGNLSEAMRKAGGKMMPFGWFHLLKAMKFKHEKTVLMLLIAVRPDMQGLGVNALIFDDLIPIYNKKGYEWAETAPQLENNVKELSQWKYLNPETMKRRRCWGKEVRS